MRSKRTSPLSDPARLLSKGNVSSAFDDGLITCTRVHVPDSLHSFLAQQDRKGPPWRATEATRANLRRVRIGWESPPKASDSSDLPDFIGMAACLATSCSSHSPEGPPAIRFVPSVGLFENALEVHVGTRRGRLSVFLLDLFAACAANR